MATAAKVPATSIISATPSTSATSIHTADPHSEVASAATSVSALNMTPEEKLGRGLTLLLTPLIQDTQTQIGKVQLAQQTLQDKIDALSHQLTLVSSGPGHPLLLEYIDRLSRINDRVKKMKNDVTTITQRCDKLFNIEKARPLSSFTPPSQQTSTLSSLSAATSSMANSISAATSSMAAATTAAVPTGWASGLSNTFSGNKMMTDMASLFRWGSSSPSSNYIHVNTYGTNEQAPVNPLVQQQQPTSSSPQQASTTSPLLLQPPNSNQQDSLSAPSPPSPSPSAHNNPNISNNNNNNNSNVASFTPSTSQPTPSSTTSQPTPTTAQPTPTAQPVAPK